MIVEMTKLKDVLLIRPTIHKDHRGWFCETYSRITWEDQGIHVDFVQDNHSMSVEKGTLRGLHFQAHPEAQTKLVRCTKGRIFDVAVDLRADSPTYKEWMGVELSSENGHQLLIPKGFAHGFVTLTEEAEVQYKVDAYYSREHDRSIRFDDPVFAIDWGVKNPILSEKDRRAPSFEELDVMDCTWGDGR